MFRKKLKTKIRFDRDTTGDIFQYQRKKKHFRQNICLKCILSSGLTCSLSEGRFFKAEKGTKVRRVAKSVRFEFQKYIFLKFRYCFKRFTHGSVERDGEL